MESRPSMESTHPAVAPLAINHHSCHPKTMPATDTLCSFDDFLCAARAQPDAQRLLFVFGVAELPPAHSPGQARRYREGRGGALAPVMCVDKAADEVADFTALAAESQATGQPWDLVFAAALPGAEGQPPAPAQVEQALRAMIGAVHRGAVERFLVFDTNGRILSLS